MVSMEIEGGVYTVLMTPFNQDYKIDFDDYNKLLNKLESSNVKGIVVLGTTSESPTLTYDEKITLVKLVWNKFKGKKRVMVGVGGNNTMSTLEFARNVKDMCDYMMITVPNYNKPSQRGIYTHFKTVCLDTQLENIPFVLYNVPSRCGVSVSPDTIAETFNDCKNVCAIKEASGSLEQVLAIRHKCDIQIFSGDDSLTVPIMSIGGSGVISVIGNILPNAINQVYENCLANNYDSATREYMRLHPIIKSLFIESNPVPGKEILMKSGVFKTNLPRLPLVPISEKNSRIVMENYYNYMNNIV